MEHNTETRHTYYASKDTATALVSWLIKCEYWFEGCAGAGGDFAITCAIEPEHVFRGIRVKIDEAA